MKTIQEFSHAVKKSTTNVVWLFHKGDFKGAFYGKDAIFSAVNFMNLELKNFRLDGVTLFCIEEPSLKDMGLLHLSRVEKVTYLEPIEESLNHDWDAFKVHKVKRELYVAGSLNDRDASGD
jgi:hypothetical protein